MAMSARCLPTSATASSPAVVDPADACGDRGVAAGPVADGELEGQQVLAGVGRGEQAPEPGPTVATTAVGGLDGAVDQGLLPGVEHGVQQRLAVAEVVVEAPLGHLQGRGDGLDPDGVRTTRRQRSQARLDPGGLGGAEMGRHDRSFADSSSR